MNDSCSILLFRGEPPVKPELIVIQSGHRHNIFRRESKCSDQTEKEKKEDPKM